MAPDTSLARLHSPCMMLLRQLSLPQHIRPLHAPLSPQSPQGATGFGSAILHSLVWICFTSAGVNGGTLLQSVVVECIYGVVLAVPLLFLMDAFRCEGEGRGHIGSERVFDK